MYKCNECGHIFEKPEEWRECRGEFWGVMSYETMIGCPACYSTDFEEVREDQEDEDENENDDEGEERKDDER